MINFWQHILTKLKENQKVYLLTVIQNLGSSPGRKGFKMFVSQDGFLSGSIGGGVMEYKFVERVKKILRTNNLEIHFSKQIHQSKVKNSSGMICSGEQTIVMHPIDFSTIKIIEKIMHTITQNKNGILKLTPNTINFIEDEISEQYTCLIKSNKDWIYKEQLNYQDKIYIIGAGHVGLAVSKLLSTLNFYIEIFDDRTNLNTYNQNDFAVKKQIIDYNYIADFIESNSYVLIMTTKYVSDVLVLEKVLKSNKKLNYLGVLGSENKIEIMFKKLISEGFKKEVIQNLYAPIGLPIYSQTPEEIAVSIVAQIIQIKNRN